MWVGHVGSASRRVTYCASIYQPSFTNLEILGYFIKLFNLHFDIKYIKILSLSGKSENTPDKPGIIRVFHFGFCKIFDPENPVPTQPLLLLDTLKGFNTG